MEDDHSLTFELVNDKLELTEAIEWLLECRASGYEDFNLEDHLDQIDSILDLVPRLMRSYEDLLETSYALADAWESYMNDQTPAGLYVPS